MQHYYFIIIMTIEVIMVKIINVVEAKKRFSEIIGEVSFKKEKFIIKRKNRPVAAIVTLQDLEEIRSKGDIAEKRGLIAALGAWEEFEDLEDVIEEIYKKRAQAKDRDVSF